MIRLARSARAVILSALALSASPASAKDFAERSPGLLEDCLVRAAADDAVSETDDGYKYICSGDPAQRFWDFLQGAGGEAWVQETLQEGAWDSRAFPLGGCFKRIRNHDGTPATDGLSCSIWIPRPKPRE